MKSNKQIMKPCLNYGEHIKKYGKYRIELKYGINDGFKDLRLG